MIIESLELLNFRNYERECFIFDENTNVLYGDNAQGKTKCTGSNLFLLDIKISPRK